MQYVDESGDMNLLSRVFFSHEFPALGACYMDLIRVLIGSFCCFEF